MKKITLLLAVLILGLVAFATDITPVITKVYEFSGLNGNKPLWMHSISERNMAYYNGKIYIPSVFNGNKIYIIDPSNGLLTDSIALPTNSIYGGAVEVCGIQITPSGKILVANLTTDAKTSNFQVYCLTNTSGKDYVISTIINWSYSTTSTTQFRCGDHFAILGDLTSGTNGYIMSANTKDKTVYKWDITNGVVANNPILITLDGIYPDPTPAKPAVIHYGPVIYPVDINRFIINSARMNPTMYNMSGTKISSFDGTGQPKVIPISGVSHFNLKNRSFFITGTTNSSATDATTGALNPGPLNAFEVFEILGGEYNLSGAKSLGVFPELGFGVDNNSTYNVPIAINSLSDNLTQFYVMVPNVGFGAYNLSIGATAINNISDYQLIMSLSKNTHILNFNSTVKRVELFNLSGQLIRKETQTNKFDVLGLHGVYIIKACLDNDELVIRKIIID